MSTSVTPIWRAASISGRTLECTVRATADVAAGADAADAVCASLRLISHATSLGAVESTIERRACIPGQEHLPPSLLRLSVGIEAVEDLWRDLDRALRLAVSA